MSNLAQPRDSLQKKGIKRHCVCVCVRQSKILLADVLVQHEIMNLVKICFISYNLLFKMEVHEFAY